MTASHDSTGLAQWAPLGFLVAALSVLGLVVAMRPPPLRADEEFRIEPAQGAQLGAWLGHPSSGLPDGWAFAAGEIRTDHAVFTYARGGDSVKVELHQRETVADALAQTERFALRAVPGTSPPPPALVDTLAASLRTHDTEWRWQEASSHPTPSWLRRVVTLQLDAVWFLLAQLPLWLVLALGVGARSLRDLPRAARTSVLAAILCAAVIRLVFAPHRLVSLYVGYQLTAQALTLHPLPRYGAATAAFHHVLLALGGADHRVILWAHSVLGVLVVPLVAALARAAFDRTGERPHVASAAAWLWALLPPVIAHDTSEANSLPLVLWMAAGLVLLFDAVTQRRPVALVGAGALLALAMVGRPEFMALVPAAAAVVLAVALRGTPPGTGRWVATRAAPLVLAVAALCVPHAVHVGESAAVLAQFDSLPLGRSPVGLPVAVLDAALWPVLLVPLALVGALSPAGARRAGLGLLALTALDVVLTRVDLDRANILRVQVPGALFYVLVAAAGLERAVQLAGRRRAVVLVGGLALVASAFAPARAAWQRTNEDVEEAFVRDALAALPDGALDFVRLGYADVEGAQGGSPAHLYFPDYLVASPVRRVTDIADWERAQPLDARPSFFYLGVRCYTPERPGFERPTGALRPACARFLAAHRVTAVLERTEPGRGDPLRTGYYADPPTPMRLGLYRVER